MSSSVIPKDFADLHTEHHYYYFQGCLNELCRNLQALNVHYPEDLALARNEVHQMLGTSRIMMLPSLSASLEALQLKVRSEKPMLKEYQAVQATLNELFEQLRKEQPLTHVMIYSTISSGLSTLCDEVNSWDLVDQVSVVQEIAVLVEQIESLKPDVLYIIKEPWSDSAKDIFLKVEQRYPGTSVIFSKSEGVGISSETENFLMQALDERRQNCS